VLVRGRDPSRTGVPLAQRLDRSFDERPDVIRDVERDEQP
jgi:hypothetical protein